MTNQDTFLDLSRYRLSHHIGSGGFSEVFQVKNIDNGEYFAAKISNFIVDEETENNPETLSLFREINLMSLLNHPSILKFVGYSQTDFEGEHNPTIVTEYAPNGSLQNIIDLEDSGLSPQGWDMTKKLINIYGIAAGMAYLHSHNVIHRDLKPGNVLMDEYLHPKISDFGLSKITDFLSISMNQQSQKGFKGTPIYMAPEIFINEEYSKATDVYAFSIVVYEILTLNKPYSKWSINRILYKVANEGYRPEISEDIPDCFRQLIEKCWSKKPEERPSFKDILVELKTNEEFFMSELINESEFFDYADFIDHCHSSFDTSNQLIHFNDFIKMNGRIKSIETIKISNIHQKQDEVNEKQDEMNEKQDEVNENQDEVNEKQDEVNVKKEEKIVAFDENIPHKFDDVRIQDDSSPQKIFEIDESTKFFVFPLSDFEKLNVKCEKIVNDAQYDIEKQFIVGKRLLEGNGDFQQNVSVGLKYIKHSMSKNCLQSIIYYSRMLIKGNIIKKDLEKAKKIIHSISKTKDNQIFVLNGKIAKKEKNFKEARYHFLNGLKNKDDESIYKYAKMLFLGEGGKKNEKEAFKYFK